jgi:membrane protein implicated in regulation of membrane protease activity
MDAYLVWALAGLGLVIVELLSGTFYLLVLGIACFGAAGAAWLGFAFPLQVLVAALAAGSGTYLVRAYRTRNAARQMPNVDLGQPANFEQWIDRASGLARVRYRGASWEANIEGDAALDPGALVYVLGSHGNTLRISKNRPA